MDCHSGIPNPVTQPVPALTKVDMFILFPAQHAAPLPGAAVEGSPGWWHSTLKGGGGGGGSNLPELRNMRNMPNLLRG